MNFVDLKNRVDHAIGTLLVRDKILFGIKVSEWAVAHRLAVYLEREIPGWDVDCEYNRQGPDGEKKANDSGNIVRPDILIHQRTKEEEGDNLLVIELKLAKNDVDADKAKSYTKPLSPKETVQFPFIKERRSAKFQYGLSIFFTGT